MLKKILCICLIVLLALPAVTGFSEIGDGEATQAHPRTEPLHHGNDVVTPPVPTDDTTDETGDPLSWSWERVDPLGLLSLDNIFELDEDGVNAAVPETDFEFYGHDGTVSYNFYGGGDTLSEFRYTISPESYEELIAAYDEALNDLIYVFGDDYSTQIYDSTGELFGDVISYEAFDAYDIKKAYDYDDSDSFFFDMGWENNDYSPVLSIYIATSGGTPDKVDMDLIFSEPYDYGWEDDTEYNEDDYVPDVDEFIDELRPDNGEEYPILGTDGTGYDPLGLTGYDAADKLAELAEDPNAMNFSMMGLYIYVAPIEYYGDEGMAVCIAENGEPVVVMYLAVPDSFDGILSAADGVLTDVAAEYGKDDITMGVMDYESATGAMERDSFTRDEIEEAYYNVDSRITYAYMWEDETTGEFTALVGLMLNEDGFDGGVQDYVCAAFMTGSFSSDVVSAAEDFGAGIPNLIGMFD